MSDKQVKSKARVAKHGEVFTNPREVNAMLDLVQDQIMRIDATFLEPACGSGNFLVEILRRRMAYLNQKYKTSLIQYQPATVQAVCGLYGIELLSDNAADCRAIAASSASGCWQPSHNTISPRFRLPKTIRACLMPCAAFWRKTLFAAMRSIIAIQTACRLSLSNGSSALSRAA